MSTDLPISQRFDAFELESKGLREFYKIEFLDANETVLYLTPHNEVVWLGHKWEFLPCKIAGNAKNSNGEVSRPKLSIVNPQGRWSQAIETGLSDGAMITMYRTLLSDMEAGVAAYSKAVWIMSKVVSLTKDLAVFELRSTLDGASYQLPARSFYPPDFPTVSLQ